MLISILKKKWITLTKRGRTSRIDFWTFRLTPIRLSLRRSIEHMLGQEYLGKVLDVGAGSLLYKDFLEKCSNEYVSADLYSDHVDVDSHCDIKKLEFPDKSFDTVFCNQVLEHVDEPIIALEEMRRVLKDDGMLFVGVPFYFYIHSAPHDYYRFTEYGIKHLLTKSGFEVDDICSSGGYFSAFIEPFNIILTSLGMSAPVLQNVVNGINLVFLVLPAYCLDLFFKTSRWFPCSYICISKPRLSQKIVRKKKV